MLFAKFTLQKANLYCHTLTQTNKNHLFYIQTYRNNTILLLHKASKPGYVSFCYYYKLVLLCSTIQNLHKAHEIGH